MKSYFGEDKANQAIEQMDDLVVKMLLVLEPSLFTFFMSLNIHNVGKQMFRYVVRQFFCGPEQITEGFIIKGLFDEEPGRRGTNIKLVVCDF